MTQSYYPFDSGAGGSVTEAQWQKMAQHWLSTGVIKKMLNELQVYADSRGMAVMVKSGQAWVNGHFFESDAEEVLPISSSPPTNPRIDRVIIRLDWTSNTIQFAVLQGTPASIPTAPVLTQNSSRWEISLAQVVVNASATTISAGNVTDERVYALKLSDFISVNQILTLLKQPHVYAFRNATLACSSGVATKVTFDGVNVDVWGEFVNNIYTAKEAGKYEISFQSLWGTAPTGDTYHYVYKNGSLFTQRVAGAGIKYPQTYDIIQLNAGDRLEFYVLQNSGGTAQTLTGCNVQVCKKW
jgi:hypothetical protein